MSPADQEPIFISSDSDRKRWRGDIVHLEADRRAPIGYVTGPLSHQRPGRWSVILGGRRG